MQKSLFADAYNAEGLEGAEIIENRRCDIGKLCREQLLGYFVNDGTVSTMRRWVSVSPLSILALLMNPKAGALCIELFLNCKENCEWIELGPEELRYKSLRLPSIGTANFNTDEASDVWSSTNPTKSCG